MSKPLLTLTSIFFASTFLFAGCTDTTSETKTPEKTVFCTQEAQQCSDGSFVSRVPPACEFSACPTSALNTNSPMSKTPTITLSAIQKLALNCTTTQATNSQTRCPAVGDTLAKITTDKGIIWLRLFPELTPKAVENFVGLTERGYYDGLTFHRVIPDFMIQGGDPNGNGTGGTSIWGTDFADEIAPTLKNIRGALAMANRGPNTNGSQFFIVQADASWLDGGYTVFGQTFSGLDVVDEIVNVPRDGGDKPLTSVKMSQVEIQKVVK